MRIDFFRTLNDPGGLAESSYCAQLKTEAALLVLTWADYLDGLLLDLDKLIRDTMTMRDAFCAGIPSDVLNQTACSNLKACNDYEGLVDDLMPARKELSDLIDLVADLASQGDAIDCSNPDEAALAVLIWTLATVVSDFQKKMVGVDQTRVARLYRQGLALKRKWPRHCLRQTHTLTPADIFIGVYAPNEGTPAYGDCLISKKQLEEELYGEGGIVPGIRSAQDLADTLIEKSKQALVYYCQIDDSGCAGSYCDLVKSFYDWISVYQEGIYDAWKDVADSLAAVDCSGDDWENSVGLVTEKIDALKAIIATATTAIESIVSTFDNLQGSCPYIPAGED